MARLVPPRYNEGWGTWHAKVYGADDELIISGCVSTPPYLSTCINLLYLSANLNESYFTNRQDRYVHFKQHAALANYCFDFLKTTSAVSYRLLPANSQSQSKSSLHSYVQEDYAIVWPDQETHPHHINDKYRQALIELQSKAKAASVPSDSTDPNKNPDHALLFPVIQAGQFNIREEQEMFELLFHHLRRNATSGSVPGTRPLLDLTSGYFGLSSKYQDLVLGCPEVDVRIVAASPKVSFSLVCSFVFS
jgi:CDP-diacylglycerol---glycerol-3-phosphate 3-phosphatidyltransferase